MSFKTSLVLGVIIILIIALVVVFPWFLLYTSIKSQPNPASPVEQYGEFPFQLIYEVDGVVVEVKDTLIFEYDGIGMNEGSGKFRKWKSRLASGDSNILLLDVNTPRAIASENVETVKQVIYFEPGPAWYYMDDNAYGSTYDHLYPDARFNEQYADGSSATGIITAEELLQKFNIKLIKWEYTEPIENVFSE